MRKIFSTTVEQLLEKNPKVVTLLGDIGVYAFQNSMKKFPNRVINLGILEQSMVGIAAGMSKLGLIPFVHTIAPFLVERAYEQLKIDFGYQNLSGNFVSVGATSDYSTLGCTHHCPADVELLKAIPGFEIYVPGTSEELKLALLASYENMSPTYYRLSEQKNSHNFANFENLGTLVKSGTRCTIIVFGPLLDIVLNAVEDLDVEVLYCYRLQPLDSDLISKNCKSRKIVLVEPFYKDTMFSAIANLFSESLQIRSIGFPREFIRKYGTFTEHLELAGITSKNIRLTVNNLIEGD